MNSMLTSELLGPVSIPEALTLALDSSSANSNVRHDVCLSRLPQVIQKSAGVMARNASTGESGGKVLTRAQLRKCWGPDGPRSGVKNRPLLWSILAQRSGGLSQTWTRCA